MTSKSWQRLGRPSAPGMVASLTMSADGALVVASMIAPDPAGDVDRWSLWVTATTGGAGWERVGPEDGLVQPRFAPAGTGLLGFGGAGSAEPGAIMVHDAGAPRAVPSTVHRPYAPHSCSATPSLRQAREAAAAKSSKRRGSWPRMRSCSSSSAFSIRMP